jgi:hypothetical protein
MLDVICDGHAELLHAGAHRLEDEVAHDLPVALGNEPIPLAMISRRIVLGLLAVDAVAGAVKRAARLSSLRPA